MSNELINIYTVTFHATGNLGDGPTEGVVRVNAESMSDAKGKAMDRIMKKYPHDNDYNIYLDTIQDIYGGMVCKF